MAISRSLMNRQLQADGGIMNLSQEGIGGGDYKGQDMGSRTGFNILKKVGKRVRKLIPNEIANIAVSAAPFVAPFNPALAGAMAGIGSFDQTGNFGDAFKRGALTYGGGQAARYAGGAGFQGNPFTSGAFTPSGFTSGFSSPLGSDTGLGKFFSNQGTAAKEGVQGIDMATGGADGVGVIPDATTSSVDMITGGADGVGIIQDTVSENMLLPKAKPILTGSPNQMTITDSIKQIVSPNSTMGDRGNAALDLLRRGSKAMFTKPDGEGGTMIDKAAVMGAVAFAGSYAEALALANDAGVELTEETYNEARKTEKQEEYASYLTNFFGGKKDGGRIGLKFGTKPEEAEVGIMTVDVEAGDDEGEEDMMMAYEPGSFTSAQKSYMFRRLAAMGGKDRSITMPDLYKIFKNPGQYPADELVIKSILDANGLKDGGRIGLKGGSGSSNRVAQLILERDYLLSKDEDVSYIDAELESLGYKMRSEGGVMDVKMPTGQIRKNNAGVVERDYRDEGGFVPVGIKERADDVPAMLSKNEFVMTADAVRGIGNGSVEEGSKKLYNTMKQAEKIGKA